MLFSAMDTLPWATATMLLFALFLKMSNGATYSVVPFINKKAIGAVSGIVGAGGNVGAVMAGFLFKSETISYQQSLFIIGMVVVGVSVVAVVMSLSRKTADELLQLTPWPPKAEKVEPVGVMQEVVVSKNRI